MTDDLRWRKSSYSGGNTSGECVEIGIPEEGSVEKVGIRDSKDPEGGVFIVAPAAFRGFLQAVKQLNRPR